MFDVGFWELALIGVVALLVVGPERLPALARTVGVWVRKLRTMVAEVKSDIEREVRADELKKSLEEVKGLRDAYDSLEETRQGVEDAVSTLSDTRETFEQSLQEAAPEVPDLGLSQSTTDASSDASSDVSAESTPVEDQATGQADRAASPARQGAAGPSRASGRTVPTQSGTSPNSQCEIQSEIQSGAPIAKDG